jgi:hypothetical protein
MSLFCMVWAPLVLLFWFSLDAGGNPVVGGNVAGGAGSEKPEGSGGVWALGLGVLVSLVHAFFGPFVKAAGFGLSRWFFALVDIVFIPAVLPFLFLALFTILGLLKDRPDPAKFVLFALLPAGVIRAVGWGAKNDPLYLVLVPVLWTALALGISFLVRIARARSFLVRIPCFLAVFLLPFTAASAFWAFYGQRDMVAIPLLAAVSIPALIVVIPVFLRVSRT